MKSRWIFAFLVTMLSLPVFAAGPQAQQQVKPAKKSRPGSRDGLSGYRYLLGRISLQHVQVCLGDQDEDWVDPHYEAGFVRLVTRKDLQLQALEGKPALLWGEVDPDKHFPHPGHKGHCPGRQARSDWVFSKKGVRLLRTIRQLRPESFDVVQAQAFEGLTVKKVGHEIEVSLRNDLPVSLSAVEIVVHYEGCYGKPGSVEKTKGFDAWPVGETLTARFPTQHKLEKEPGALWPAKGRRDHVAHSLQLRSEDSRVLVDLDLPLSALLGKRLSCSDEKGGK